MLSLLVLAVVSLIMFFFPPIYYKSLEGIAINLIRLVIISLTSILAIKLIGQRKLGDEYRALDSKSYSRLKILVFLIPCLVLVISLLQVFFPEVATNFIRNEGKPFFRLGIFIKVFFELIGAIMFFQLARYYFKKQLKVPAILAVAIIFILLLMIGEELSWGQRIFGWETPEKIANLNQQSETNLHNLYTQEFQNILYFGGFTLLVILPFWRNSFKKLLQKTTKFKFLVDWLPPAIFVPIFIASFAVCDPIRSETGLAFASNMFIVLTAIIILGKLCLESLKNPRLTIAGHKIKRFVYGLTAIFAIVVTNSLFIAKSWEVNPGAVTEYLEVFICFGIMIWSIYLRNTIVKKSARR